ncbi:MAG: 6-phosphogluconolactonase, partial [Candidatus Dormiibacterota bacterium]
NRAGALLTDALRTAAEARVVLASAPSQAEFLAALPRAAIEWARVEAFHMDEYLGIAPDSPQSFSQFLRVHLFGSVEPGAFHVLDGTADPAAEAERYTRLLRRSPLHLVCCGVGENGHIAFNDPGNADFDDPATVKEVVLPEAARRQQVHDGMFPNLESVPERALTVTVPALLSAAAITCVVPGPTKRVALARMLQGPIDEECPASILRRHPNCTLYTDPQAYA